jgi:hypothetical protein
MKKKRTRGWDLIDMTGRRCGRLRVLSRVPNTHPNPHRTKWKCLCKCGKEVDRDGVKLRNGTVQSCGCLVTEERIAARFPPSRALWSYLMRDPKQVCVRWRKFEVFDHDIKRPKRRSRIVRINKMKPYGPKNYRWQPVKMLTVAGETAPIGVFASRLGCHPEVIRGRLRLGWPEDRAAMEPVTGVRLPYRLGTCPKGHDWNDPYNVTTESDGGRRCIPCRKLSREARP